MTEYYQDTPIANIGGLDCYRRKIPYEMMTAAVKDILQRHPVLRLRLRQDGSFYLPAYKEPEIFCYDRRECSEAAITAMAQTWMKEPFPLYDHDLYEVRYIEGAQEDYAFFKFHHLICDGYTIVMMLREQEQIYDRLLAENKTDQMTGKQTGQTEKEHQNEVREKQADQSAEARQDQAAENPQDVEDKAYLVMLGQAEYLSEQRKCRAEEWYERYRGTSCASWKFKERARKPEAERLSFTIEKSLMKRLQDFAGQHHLFYETLIYGAVFAWIFCRKDTQTAAIGRVLSNRTKQNMKSYGMYASTLPLFLNWNDEEKVTDFLKRIQRELFTQQKYAAYGYQELAEKLGFTETVFDISVSYRSKRLFPADHCSIGKELFSGCSEIPLRIFAEELDGQLYLTLQYQLACYKRSEIENCYRGICGLLQQLTGKEHVSELSALTPEEIRCIHALNDCAYIEAAKTVPQMILAQMHKKPEQTAVCMENGQISYRDLEKRMEQTARYLFRRGVRTGDVVGVCMERSLWLTPVLLGIWKAGAAFVTIGTAESDVRKKKLCQGSRYCITEEDIAYIQNIQTDSRTEDSRITASDTGTDPGALPAYQMYTSGTTGEPKAAVISHRSLAIRLLWMMQEYECGEKVLQKTPYTFDVSLWELFLPLIAGKISVLLEPGEEKFPAAVGNCIRRKNISMLHFVPTMLQIFLKEAEEENRKYPQVKTLICSGEALTPALVQQAYQVFPESLIANFYGPTECTIDVLHYRCRPGDTKIPVGQPAADTNIYIVSRNRHILPPGSEGEICITGDLVGIGYDGIQSEAFGTFLGQRAYFTGDYGMLGADGMIYYSGRKDRQYKIRGMRVDLLALESVLQTHPQIQQAAAAVKENRIQVCCLAQKEVPHLREWLAEKLPPQQIPAELFWFMEFPHHANGKLDQKLLWEQADAKRQQGTQEKREVLSEKERFFKEVIEEKTGRKNSSVTESFLEAGLDSLRVFEIVTELRSRGIAVSCEDFYRYTTIRELAGRTSADTGILCCLHKGNEQTKKLFLGIPYAGGTPWLFAALGRQKEFGDYACYALSTVGNPHKRVEAFAHEAVRRLLELQSYEEYVVFGYCVGSAIAAEIAAQLEQKGRNVRLCIAAARPVSGIRIGKTVRSYWDFCSDRMMAKILESMCADGTKIPEETAKQFKVDVRRFFVWRAEKKQLPFRGTCTLILAKGDPFTGKKEHCRLGWAAFLGKNPSKIRIFEMKQGGHFFLRKCGSDAVMQIRRAITEP